MKNKQKQALWLLSFILLFFILFTLMKNKTIKESFTSNDKNEYDKIEKSLNDLQQTLDTLENAAKQNETSIKEMMKKVQDTGIKARKAATNMPPAKWPPDHHD